MVACSFDPWPGTNQEVDHFFCAPVYALRPHRMWHTQMLIFPFISAMQGAADAATTPGAASVRPPSVTLAILLITQIQFLATLSLVDSTGANDSLLSELVRNLRSDWCQGILFFHGTSSSSRTLVA